MTRRIDVTEGYITNKHASSSSSLRAHSDTAIFRSANDTLHDVYAMALSSQLSNPVSPLKRPRGLADQGTQSDEGEGTEMQCESSVFSRTASESQSVFQGKNARPVKPLRKPHKTASAALVSTRSLPILFTDRSDQPSDTTAMSKEADTFEGEDWSSPANGETSFEPMVL